MKTTNQIIKEMEKEFDRQFVKYNGRYIEDSFIDPNGLVGPVRKFIKEYTRSLLSAFAEEVIGKRISEYRNQLETKGQGRDKSKLIRARNDGYNRALDDVMLKAKEIIGEVGK